ncbi:hypothetical protein RND71_017239 [Anisodus tanguticus]|uniref:General transcription factor 3C polypeptide 3 n=1 Tax=Anisodus tanguticus TaxID=243964 RepID=A0AAE1S3E7_9SOLA|nr:hypothetical protein RND71_017239 [Anisodus tanguticus]
MRKEISLKEQLLIAIDNSDSQNSTEEQEFDEGFVNFLTDNNYELLAERKRNALAACEHKQNVKRKIFLMKSWKHTEVKGNARRTNELEGQKDPKNKRKAAKFYALAAEIMPRDTSLWMFFLSCYLEQGDAAAVDWYLPKAIAAEPEDISLRLLFASRGIELKKYEKAVKVYEEVFQLHPDNIEACISAAKFYKQLGKTERSVVILEHYLKYRTTGANPMIIDMLTNICIENGEYAKALQHIEGYLLGRAFGLEIANDNVDSVVEITDKLKSLEHYEYALHYYLVLGRNQDDGILNLKIAQCYLSLEKGRGNSILLQSYEECWPKKKKKLPTLPTLQLLIDEENHQLVIDLAKALASLGRYEDALDICKWTLNFVSDVITSDNTEELTLLGTQMAYNVIDPRRGFFRSIREKKKDCVPPIIISGHQFSVRSECQAAAEEYLHAYKLLPDSPFINLCIGTALINLAFDVRIKNKHQCVVQDVAFLFKEKDYPIPQLPYESQHLRENQNSGYCSLHREAAYNLHLIYKTSGALGLARQIAASSSSSSSAWQNEGSLSCFHFANLFSEFSRTFSACYLSCFDHMVKAHIGLK